MTAHDQLVSTVSTQAHLTSTLRQDWGDAIDVSIFYGRTQELTTLQQWITQDRCRLVTLLGIGGTGKTSLSVKLAETIQGEFESLIWRSLRDAPPLDELLTMLIQVLSQRQETDLPDSIGGKLSCLIERLKRSRAEWITSGMASFVLAIVVGLVGYTWLDKPQQQQSLLSVLNTETIRAAEGQFYVPFTVINSGGETAESVQI